MKISDKSFTFKLDEMVTVKTAKSIISKKLKIPPYQQRLLCGDKKLKDHLTLSDCKEIPGWPNLQLIKSMFAIRAYPVGYKRLLFVASFVNLLK